MTNFGCVRLTHVVNLLSPAQIEFGQLGDDFVGTVATAARVLRLIHFGTLVRQSTYRQTCGMVRIQATILGLKFISLIVDRD